MIRKIYLVIGFAIILSIGACGKKGEETETVEIGNGGNQINVVSVNEPGGEISCETSGVEIGKEKSDTLVIVIDWDKILINDSECGSIEEMKNQIIKSGCKKIDLQHSDANKKMLDEVIDALTGIEEALEIDINYN